MFQELCQRQQQKISTIQQSVECIKSTTLSVLSTIAYLRDLFPESVFYQHSFAQLPLKKIKRGIINEADSFLDWIEKGCFDAINRNYLKCIVFAIYCHQSKLIETFTINVNTLDCPTGKGTMNVGYRGNVMDNPFEVKESQDLDIYKSINKLLKTVCLIVQQLEELPEVKCLTMKLYYTDKTPENYQPPFFKSAQNNSSNALNDEIKGQNVMTMTFGQSETPFHGIEVKMCTIKGKNVAIPPTLGESQKQQPSDNLVQSQIPQLAPAITNSLNYSVEIIDDQPPKEKPSCGVIKCSCQANQSDLGMICCDFCGFWHHCVCMGFLSGDDSRIPPGKFKCYTCKYQEKGQEIVDYLRFLCLFRRTIQVLLQERITSYSIIAKRLSIDFSMARKLHDRLIREGFIGRVSTPSGRKNWIPITTEEVKKKTVEFFIADVEQYPEVKSILGQSSNILDKRLQPMEITPAKRIKVSVPINDIQLSGYRE
jgi:hypothetical protein